MTLAYSGFFLWLLISIIDNLKRRLYSIENLRVVYSLIKTPYGSFIFIIILNLGIILFLEPKELKIMDVLSTTIFSWTIAYLTPSFFEAQTNRGWIIMKYKGTFVGLWGIIKSRGLIALVQSIIFGVYYFTSVYLVSFKKEWSLIDYFTTMVSPKIVLEIVIFIGIITIFYWLST